MCVPVSACEDLNDGDVNWDCQDRNAPAETERQSIMMITKCLGSLNPATPIMLISSPLRYNLWVPCRVISPNIFHCVSQYPSATYLHPSISYMSSSTFFPVLNVRTSYAPVLMSMTSTYMPSNIKICIRLLACKSKVILRR